MAKGSLKRFSAAFRENKVNPTSKRIAGMVWKGELVYASVFF